MLRTRLLRIWLAMMILLAMEVVSYSVIGYVVNYYTKMAWESFNHGAIKWSEVDSKTPYAEFINRSAHESGVSASLIAAVIQAESSFQSRALSHSGAYGLMQIVPDTWRQVNQESKVCSGRHSGECSSECYYSPELNIKIGTVYLAQLIARYDGKLVLALAAYNAGPGSVDHYGGVPPYRETRGYITQIIANWYDRVGTEIPTYSQSAHRWAEVQRILGWCSIFTLIVLVLIVWGLVKRNHSWRWR